MLADPTHCRQLDLAALRLAHPLPEIAAGSIKLQRSGDEWKGCCPFHADSSPSFTIRTWPAVPMLRLRRWRRRARFRSAPPRGRLA